MWMKDSIPLWKQFYLKQKEENQNANQKDKNGKKEQELQSFYKYLLTQRTAQQLPPVFGVLSGPTLVRPYRMEETRIILGRISQSRRMADVHISSISKVSHQHCVIEWDQTKGAYVLELLSSNGVEVGPLPPSQTLEYHTPGTRITLPNPCQIIIQTVPLFFQCFYVAVEPEPEPEQPEPVAQYSVTSIASSRSKRSARSQGLTSSVFREMIEEALEDAGGKATQKEIIEYIDNWHPEVVQKKNWRHSVSGILSSNPTIFSTEPAMLPSGKRARYALWGLRRVTGETLEVVEDEQLSCGTVQMLPVNEEPPEKKQKINNSDSEGEQLQIDSDEETLQIDDSETI